jgi:hypothetical protein
MDPKLTTPTTQSSPSFSQNVPSAELEHSGWSWGAAMLNATYLIAIKKYKYLLLYLLFLVPFVGFMGMIVMFVYLGLRGRKLAYESSMFKNKGEVDGFMRAVDHVGKVMFFISLIVIVIWIVIMFSFGSTLLNQFKDTKLN